MVMLYSRVTRPKLVKRRESMSLHTTTIFPIWFSCLITPNAPAYCRMSMPIISIGGRAISAVGER